MRGAGHYSCGGHLRPAGTRLETPRPPIVVAREISLGLEPTLSLADFNPDSKAAVLRWDRGLLCHAGVRASRRRGGHVIESTVTAPAVTAFDKPLSRA